MSHDLERLRYPIGRFAFPENLTSERKADLRRLETLPAEMRRAVAGLDDAQLDTPYRDDGWTVRQVVHHVADSHMNSYVRMKLAATENEPTIQVYDEKAWAELADARGGPVETSLDLLTALHWRLIRFLRSLDAASLARTLRHPELGRLTIAQNISIYAWHGRHHVAHITRLRRRRGWD